MFTETLSQTTANPLTLKCHDLSLYGTNKLDCTWKVNFAFLFMDI